VTGERKVVITGADPPRRIVHEIDGRPALKVYASLCGFRRAALSGEDFAPYPLMIRIGGQYYARGVQRIADGGALEFACAIERGLVVAIARPGDMVARLEELFETMCARIGMPELVIGVDCAARAAYMERQGLSDRIVPLLTRHAVTGFASLGEQFKHDPRQQLLHLPRPRHPAMSPKPPSRPRPGTRPRPKAKADRAPSASRPKTARSGRACER